MTGCIDLLEGEAAEAILEQLAQRWMHCASLRAGAEQDACSADHRANAQLCGEALPRAGNEREKAEHRGRPPDGRERFRIDEDAGGDAGGDGDGEDD